jgi:hypothetical protein
MARVIVAEQAKRDVRRISLRTSQSNYWNRWGFVRWLRSTWRAMLFQHHRANVQWLRAGDRSLGRLETRPVRRAACCTWPHSHLTMSNSPNTPTFSGRRYSNSTSRSRGALAPGVCNFPPQRGVGGAPTGAPVQRHRLACNNVAGRAPSGVPASLKAGGTRASRRSTVAILGRVPRFHLRHFLRIRAASSSRPGRSAWRAGYRTSRDNGNEPQPRDATPRSAFRIVSRRRPSMSRDGELSSIAPCGSQQINTIRVKNNN